MNRPFSKTLDRQYRFIVSGSDGKNSVPLGRGGSVQPEFCPGCVQLSTNTFSTDMAFNCKMFSVL